MSRPRLVMFDDPSLGLAPNIVERTFAIIREIRDAGTTVLLVEQNAFAALGMSDHAYLLEGGRITLRTGFRPDEQADLTAPDPAEEKQRRLF
jgi:branched-chain amino acid transport system ATP-binding protein